jgi:hypothetical protein
MELNRMTVSRNLALSLLYFCLCAFASAPGIKQDDSIKAIGCFTNVRSDGEYAYGYSVQLWSRGRQIIGLIDYYQGFIADPPMGILSDVQYDSSTGKLSFKAKLTSGLHNCRIHKDVPSHELLSFQGFLKPDKLEGDIRLENQMDSPPVVLDTRDNFLMPIDKDRLPEDYENYDAWWRFWEPIYKIRGAKW